MKHWSKDLRDRAADLKDQLAPHVETAVAKAGPALAEAREKAAPALADAREKTAPFVAGARDKAAPYVAEAKGKWHAEVLPVLTAAAAAADEATADYREEAMRRGAATAAALKGEVEAPAPKKKGRKRKILLLLGLGGIAFAAVRKLTGQGSQAWESSYQPTPAAPVTTSPAAPAPPTDSGNDTAAATPDEALADAVEAPHPATDPDNPAASVEIEDSGPSGSKG
ncbi:hypothetical protein [Nocardioides massiliensis]|uniref:Vacuolar-type H+-ATPase subunit H n=1 Tax=Nocardioides massiliensis TaxID=1325935 RepID=A0ABT9NLJ6_9ACTN|nr:hypothetical protein [Nocardioides massiliensis]MDP9821293.1 vacuolar-type H+-ATPase subunit H [Nocardioides massiliensis]